MKTKYQSTTLTKLSPKDANAILARASTNPGHRVSRLPNGIKITFEEDGVVYKLYRTQAGAFLFTGRKPPITVRSKSNPSNIRVIFI